MDAKLELRKTQFKEISSLEKTRRRTAVKSESDQARKDLISSLRELPNETPSTVKESKSSSSEASKVKRLFARTFMYPDTMLEVPAQAELEAGWQVFLRPEGERCLLILSGNTLTLRARNGNIIESFVLDPFTVKRFEGVSILEGVFGYKGLKRCIYVLDALLLKQNELIFSDFDFRQFFLNQNWPFLQASSAPMLEVDDESVGTPEIVKLEPLPATSSNIKLLYDTESGDSLVFYNRTGKYMNGLTLEALTFRDDTMSRYAIDTQHREGFEGDEAQSFVLAVTRQRGNDSIIEFQTWDHVVLLSKPESDVEKWIKDALARNIKLNKKKRILVKITVNNEFEFTSFKSSGKPFPNSFNRIVDQFRKRRFLLNLPPLGIDTMDAPPVSIHDLSPNAVS